MNKPSLVIVIVEDDRQRMLIYRYLALCGFERHAIRIERSPAAAGSAEQWVRKRFPKEVKAYRSRHAKSALITIIDADIESVQHRINQLDQALTESEMKPVDPSSEKVARLFPKRNVETWILALNGSAVDEQPDYKQQNRDWNGMIPNAAKELVRLARADDEASVDSLTKGIAELRRLNS
jgi:hypothetical protein